MIYEVTFSRLSRIYDNEYEQAEAEGMLSSSSVEVEVEVGVEDFHGWVVGRLESNA